MEWGSREDWHEDWHFFHFPGGEDKRLIQLKTIAVFTDTSLSIVLYTAYTHIRTRACVHAHAHAHPPTHTYTHTYTPIHTCRVFLALRLSPFCSPFCCLERTVERRVVILLRMAAACRGIVAVCSSSLESSTLSPPAAQKKRAPLANSTFDHPTLVPKPSLVCRQPPE